MESFKSKIDNNSEIPCDEKEEENQLSLNNLSLTNSKQKTINNSIKVSNINEPTSKALLQKNIPNKLFSNVHNFNEVNISLGNFKNSSPENYDEPDSKYDIPSIQTFKSVKEIVEICPRHAKGRKTYEKHIQNNKNIKTVQSKTKIILSENNISNVNDNLNSKTNEEHDHENFKDKKKHADYTSTLNNIEFFYSSINFNFSQIVNLNRENNTYNKIDKSNQNKLKIAKESKMKDHKQTTINTDIIESNSLFAIKLHDINDFNIEKFQDTKENLVKNNSKTIKTAKNVINQNTENIKYVSDGNLSDTFNHNQTNLNLINYEINKTNDFFMENQVSSNCQTKISNIELLLHSNPVSIKKQLFSNYTTNLLTTTSYYPSSINDTRITTESLNYTALNTLKNSNFLDERYYNPGIMSQIRSTPTIKEIVPPTFSVEIENTTIKKGETACFKGTINGSFPFETIWYIDNNKINTNNHIETSIQQDKTATFLTGLIDYIIYLKVRNCSTKDIGKYTALVKNEAGDASCSAFLIIEGKILIICEIFYENNLNLLK